MSSFFKGIFIKEEFIVIFMFIIFIIKRMGIMRRRIKNFAVFIRVCFN